MRCSSRRSCARLPRSGAALLAARVTALREDIEALDRGVIEAATTGGLERSRLGEIEEQVAGVLTVLIGAYKREGIPVPPCLGGPQPLRLLQGGAA